MILFTLYAQLRNKNKTLAGEPCARSTAFPATIFRLPDRAAMEHPQIHRRVPTQSARDVDARARCRRMPMAGSTANFQTGTVSLAKKRQRPILFPRESNDHCGGEYAIRQPRGRKRECAIRSGLAREVGSLHQFLFTIGSATALRPRHSPRFWPGRRPKWEIVVIFAARLAALWASWATDRQAKPLRIDQASIPCHAYNRR